jgi:hypothetical protein
VITFDQLKSIWTWHAIPNCPGRYKLSGGPSGLLIRDLLGFEVELQTYSVTTAKDTVIVAALSNFGIISYMRADGRFIHTLNTHSGLGRKLLSIGITKQRGAEACFGQVN